MYDKDWDAAICADAVIQVEECQERLTLRARDGMFHCKCAMSRIVQLRNATRLKNDGKKSNYRGKEGKWDNRKRSPHPGTTVKDRIRFG